MAAPDIVNSLVKAPMVVDVSLLHLITSADTMSKFVMLSLFVASVGSWTIIIEKLFRYRRVKSKMQTFEAVFWSGQVLDTLYERVKRSTDNPLSAIFVAAMSECKRGDGGKTASVQATLRVGLKERIMQAMNLVRNREMDELEHHLSILAIVGSCSLFIGLFGTVWGIIHSFQSIAVMKNATLDVVAPGIAEALLATAIGLVAAIPASISYNLFIAEINKFTNKFDDFIGELYTILTRAIDEEKL
ncbi:MAG: protein TolQ [Pseudomonadota bacterium]